MRGAVRRARCAWPRGAPRRRLDAPCGDAGDLGHTGALADLDPLKALLGRRLHGIYTDSTSPGVRVARDQDVHSGDIIISRNNDATLTVEPGAQHRGSDRIDQVRNGNRWRVVGVDTTHGCAAGRLTEAARVIFEGDYLRWHITLGYATTLHAAQGITVGNVTTRGACFTVLSDKASRAMAYVGMTRGKDENHAFIYQPITGEADHEHVRVASGAEIHKIRRGNKYSAAYYFRIILANEDRPRTTHAQADRTDRELLPRLEAALLDRNDERRAARHATWRQYRAQAHAREAADERFTEAARTPRSELTSVNAASAATASNF
jgi:hypothetical protein